MTNRRHVLLIAYINSHLPELLRVAAALQHTGRFDRTLLFVNDHENIKDDWLLKFQQQGIRVIDPNGRMLESSTSPTSNPTRTPTQQLKRSIRGWSKRWPTFGRLVEFGYRTTRAVMSYRTLRRKLQTAERLLQRLSISLIVLCEDNSVYVTNVYTKPGHSLGIPSVIVPYTIANATEAAEHAYDNKSYWVRDPLQRLVAKKYPHWVYRHKGQPLLLLNPLEIIAQEKLGLAPPDPWTINSGSADAIAAESPFMVRYYTTNHIPNNRIVLTGTFTDDILRAGLTERSRRRTQMDEEYGLDPRKPVLLCAFPPPWFPRPVCDFSNYRALIDFWMTALLRVKSFNVVMNLHPKIDRSDRDYIAGLGMTISDWDVARLIPASDLYVANISATIRWATACGLPVLNYDVYKYHFHDYDTAAGVITVESQEDFMTHLERLTNNREYFLNIKQQQQSVQADWGLLDGQSGQRMIQLFDRLITQSSMHHG